MSQRYEMSNIFSIGNEDASDDESWEPDDNDSDNVDIESNTSADPEEMPYIPPSLTHISKLTVAELVYFACLNIERKYGSYRAKKCAEKVDSLCKYLVSEVGLFVTEIWEELVAVAKRQIKFNRIQDHNILTKALNMNFKLTGKEWLNL